MPESNKNKSTLPLLRFKEGKEVVNKMFTDSIKKNGFFIDGVLYEDIDKAFQDAITNDFKIIDKFDTNKIIPVTFYNSTYRWSEFQNTWNNSDHNKNVKFPLIAIIRKLNPQQGTQRAGYWNIPGKRHYDLYKVPTFDGNREGFDLYKIPQPMPVDIDYEVKLYTYTIDLLNEFNQMFLNKYKSLEYYIKPKGLWMKTKLESVIDESQLNNIDNRKFYVQTMGIKICGYILNPEDFIIEKAVTRAIVDVHKKKDSFFYEEEIQPSNYFDKKISFLEGVNNQSFTLKSTADFNITNINSLDNISKINSIFIDGINKLSNYDKDNTLSESIEVNYGDKIIINISKIDILNKSSFILNCSLI